MDAVSPHWRIGETARMSGVNAANIRYYEKEGLLPPRTRNDARYRLYGEPEVHRLRFIRMCRAMDMSLDEVRSLLDLDLADPAHCQLARQTLDLHLGHVRQRLDELQALAADLESLRDRCDGRGGHCGIIEALHRHADVQPPPPGVGARRHL